MNSSSEIRVLHVDDDACFVEITKTILLDEGPFNIEPATSIADALNKLEKNSFDVVISDYEMPFKDGLEFFKLLREKGIMTPFILFTGKGREEIVVKALNLGIDRYVSKNGDPHTVYTELSVSIRQLYEKAQAKRLLWESEERFRLIVDNSPIMMANLNCNLQYRWIYNPLIDGLTPQDMLGKQFGKVVDIEDCQTIRNDMLKLIITPGSLHREVIIHHKNESTVLDGHFETARNQNGEVSGIFYTAYDVTQRKQMENQLKSLEERWNFALEGAGEGVWDWNPQTKEVFLSSKWKQVLGYEDHEVKNDFNEWLSRLHPDDKQNVIDENERFILKDKPYSKIYRLRAKDGSYRWVFSQGKVVTRSVDGKACRVIGTITDITEHRKSENAFKESEEKFSATFYSSGAALALTRLDDGLLVEVNDCFLETFGYTREEVIGKTARILGLYADFKERQEIIDLTLKNQPIINREVTALKKDRTELSVLFSTKIVTVNNQLHLLTTLIDVSDLKKTQRTLFMRQKELENIFEMAPDVLVITDLNGKIVTCNELSWKIFGYTKNEIIGAHGLSLVSEGDQKRIRIEFREALKNKQVYSSIFSVKHKSGREICVEGSVKVVLDKQGKTTGFIAIVRDITERKLTEKKLQESEERYRFVAEHAQDLITLTDKTGTILFVSPSIEHLAGYTPEELVSKKSVLSFIHNEDLSRLISSIRESMNKNVAAQIELRFLTKKGSYIWLESNISTVKDSNGVIKFISISRDVTQRRIDHEERKTALAKAEMLLEKLSVVGGFVRHDIRNKLTVIGATLYSSRKYANGNEQMLKQIDQIGYAIENIGRILDFAQTYEAAGSQGLSWLKVDKAVDEAKKLVPSLDGIAVETENVDIEVLADSALIEILHNLIDNSIKYGKNLSKIRIYTQKTENQNTQLIYMDNGGGIDPKIKPQLFHKGAGKGTGLGLYLIQRICDIYYWRIHEEGNPGEGVRFVLEIPQDKTRKNVVY